jgi:hypothetical protein
MKDKYLASSYFADTVNKYPQAINCDYCDKK